MKIRQHIPAFVSGLEPIEAEVKDLEELQALEFVQRFTSDPEFHRLSISWYIDCRHLLVAEMDLGKKWWVIGYVTNPDDSFRHLPEFTGAYQK